MDNSLQIQLADLMRGQRWAALATSHDQAPYASYVAYVAEKNFTGFLIHISQLAPHTKNILTDPNVSLAISATDSGEGDPQTLPRVSIVGNVITLERGSEDYYQAREIYLDRLPDAEQLFGFSDFVLFRLIPTSARFVAGFAKTWNLEPADLSRLPWC